MRTNVRSEAPAGPSVEERILAAAGRLFAQEGFHRTGMRRIAAEAGVSIGALYHYFPSKEEVFLAALRAEYERWLAEARRLWAEGAPAREVLRQVVELHFASLARGGERGFLVGRAWHGEVPGLRKALLALRDRYAQAVARLLAQAMDRGEIRRAHPLLTAYALLGLVESVTARAVGGDRVAAEVRREGPREVAELAWRALQPEEVRS
ncbi:MAG: TetR/AcrR family transcriptional regulator [Candidatus Bipolaricaulota bacterium]|nr:TetR/AcrR family transcriptional regulator [Candidatus Bipolaricaulota bacterium]